MNDNTLSVKGIDVYTHDIYYYADQYIKNELEIDKLTVENRSLVRECFNDMIFYIADNIDKPKNEDIELLDNIFNIYIRLCTKYGVLPTLEMFSILVNINRATFSDWKNGEYRSSTHSKTVKKWFDTCKSFLINNLQNSKGTDANKIFIAKAAYGMAETAPVQAEKITGLPQMTAQEIHQARMARGDKPTIELDEDGNVVDDK